MRGDYIHTFSGKKFYLMDPQPEDICIEDIAHALSNLCRFGGHSPEFYSVAEHSILVSSLVPQEDMLWGLLHDASEAYLCDIPRPFKGYLNNYKELEERIQQVIATKFSLCWPIPNAVHYIDRNIVASEANQLWRTELGWTKSFDNVNCNIILLSPQEAEYDFLIRFKYLNKINNYAV